MTLENTAGEQLSGENAPHVDSSARRIVSRKELSRFPVGAPTVKLLYRPDLTPLDVEIYPFVMRLWKAVVIKYLMGQTHGTKVNTSHPRSEISQECFLTAVKRYQCERCQRVLTSAAAYRSHQKIHRCEDPSKRYKCSFCSYSTDFASRMKIHNLVHSGERPYKCSLCNKAFTQMHVLKSHMLIHTGEKPHKCEVCLKTFRHINNLTTHMRKHLNMYPYMCRFCSKLFVGTGDLSAHEASHMNG
ncbi:hypothetical protein NPIL_200001 [Nephila pilipes]|uniref:C2H2-type domain-containing protein n=1 Tax=Nephila pilipes TaxID=299642 RepID=A0A8X6MWV2_NEPPI|nr:hypothetical protein NPIL_200001 [Nephila pilipes]